MGLDVFAARSPDDELGFWDRRAFKNAGDGLCRGIYSFGEGAFRGKVYASLVAQVTGVSLYDEWIPPETVRMMSELFDRCDPERVVREVDGAYEHTEDEVLELREFFRVCAQRNLGLVGWW